jgi:hypothetical protein
MHVMSIFTTALLCFPKKPHTQAEFEPGSSGLRTDPMTTEPRRQGMSMNFYDILRLIKVH